MGLSGLLPRCPAALGKPAKVVPGLATPALSKPPANAGAHFKMTPMPTTFGLNARPPRTVLCNAKIDDFSEVSSFQGTLPRLGALESPPPLKKASERLVMEASAAEEGSIQEVWQICTKVLGATLEADAAMMELQMVLRTAPAGVLAAWPFSGSSSHVTNLVCCNYSIPDLLHTAYHQQRVQHILPLVQELLSAVTAIQLNDCPVLRETLSLLVELYPQLPRQEQDIIASILGCWNLQQIPIKGDFLVWADEQPTSFFSPGMTQADRTSPGNGVMLFGVGQLQQSRPTAVNPSSAALQPPLQPETFTYAATISSTTQPINLDKQNGLYTQAALTAAVQAAREEEQQKAKAALEKAHAEGQQAVALARREGRLDTKRAVAYAIAKCQLNKTDTINVLQTLSEQPSDIFMIKAYYERHTNVFSFDFNAKMRHRRKDRLNVGSLQSEDFDDSNAPGFAEDRDCAAFD